MSAAGIYGQSELGMVDNPLSAMNATRLSSQQ